MLLSTPMLVALALLSGCGTWSLSAAGDLQLSSERTRDPLGALPQLLPGDLRLVNLEGPLTTAPLLAGAERVRGRPEQARWLHGRVDVASLANNHIDDAGALGHDETRRALARAGIAAVDGELLLRRHGQPIAILARSYLPDDALDDRALLDEVHRLAARHAVIVSLHWGHTGLLTPSAAQRRFAAALVDAGARVIVGHGPHSLQAVELRRGAVIAYSLGNLAFDCACTTERDAYALTVRFEHERVIAAELTPLVAGLRADVARSHDPELEELLIALSADLGTMLRRTDGVLRVEP